MKVSGSLRSTHAYLAAAENEQESIFHLHTGDELRSRISPSTLTASEPFRIAGAKCEIGLEPTLGQIHFLTPLS
jgi:hypothetical protein